MKKTAPWQKICKWHTQFLLDTFKNVLQPNNKQIIKTDEERFHQSGPADGKETYEMMYSIFGIREGKFKPPGHVPHLGNRIDERKYQTLKKLDCLGNVSISINLSLFIMNIIMVTPYKINDKFTRKCTHTHMHTQKHTPNIIFFFL